VARGGPGSRATRDFRHGCTASGSAGVPCRVHAVARAGMLVPGRPVQSWRQRAAAHWKAAMQFGCRGEPTCCVLTGHPEGIMGPRSRCEARRRRMRWNLLHKGPNLSRMECAFRKRISVKSFLPEALNSNSCRACTRPRTREDGFETVGVQNRISLRSRPPASTCLALPATWAYLS
jgi:hypothetical protein